MGAYDITGTPLGAAYDISGDSLAGVYDIAGEYSPFTVNPEPIDYTAYTQQALFSYPGGNYDGGAAYGGIFFQLIANNLLNLFDLATGQLITGSIPIDSGHGDSASFSRERYAAADEFPLLYITTDAAATQARVNVCRVTRLSSELVRAYVFPFERTGYYGAHAYDEDNGIMYIVGYSEQNYTTDHDGANKTVVSAWDMAHLTDNGDGTFTPAFISAYERPFIYCMQGLQYHDGLIWIASGYWDSYVSCVFAMDPATGEIEHTIMLNDTEEIEGIAWVYDSADNRYHLIVTQQGHVQPYAVTFSRFDFAALTTLPAEYQRLPFIVGNGTASNFDTGVAGGSDGLRFEMCLKRNAHTNYYGVWGNYVDEATNVWRILTANTNARVYTSQNTKAGNSRTITFDVPYINRRMYAIITYSRSAIALEGAKAWQSTYVTQVGTANNSNIDLGNQNVGTGSTSDTIRTWWYFFRIFSGSTLVRNYVPCKRLSDGKIGFYDTVNDTFNPSTGGAEFAEEA